VDPLWRIDPVSKQTPVVAPVKALHVESDREREASQDDPRHRDGRRRARPAQAPVDRTDGPPSGPDADGHVDIRA